MKFLRHHQCFPVGVEILANQINIAQLKPLRGGNFKLICADIVRNEVAVNVRLDPPLLSETNDMDAAWLLNHSPINWSIMRELMSHAVQSLDLVGQPTILSLPSTGVKQHQFVLPVPVLLDNVEAAIQGHLRQGMSGLADSTCLDYTILNEDGENADVFYAATRQAFMAKYVDCAVAAGLEVKVVDVDTYAMHRALSYSQKPLLQINVVNAFIIIRAISVDFIVYDVNSIIFHLNDTCLDEASVLHAMEENIKKFYSQFPYLQINRLTLSSEQDISSELTIRLAGSVKYIEVADVKHFIKIPADKQQYAALLNTDLLVACGLAMRELPRWY